MSKLVYAESRITDELARETILEILRLSPLKQEGREEEFLYSDGHFPKHQ